MYNAKQDPVPILEQLKLINIHYSTIKANSSIETTAPNCHTLFKQMIESLGYHFRYEYPQVVLEIRTGTDQVRLETR